MSATIIHRQARVHQSHVALDPVSRKTSKLDQNITNITQGAIKGHKSQNPLKEEVKNRAQNNALKNEQKIFEQLLKCKKIDCKPQEIALAVRYCARRASDQNISKDEAQAIRKFFGKLSQLDEKAFDRRALLGGRMQLQRLLSSELDELMKKEEGDSSIKDTKTHQLNLAIAKAKLAVNMGYGFEAAKEGQNGTVLVKSLEGHFIGVFKAPPKVDWWDFKTHLKKYMGQMRLLNQKDELGQQFAEVAAHKFDKAMGFNMAPAAAMAEIKGKQGAFIAFLGGFKELKSIEASLQARKKFTDHEKEIWQMMSVFNFAEGNMDAHNQNLFVKTDEAGKLSQIRVINAGNAFIEKNPGSWGSKGNQGHWGKYNISKEAFLPKVKDFILKELTEENYQKFLGEIGERKEFWSQGMDQNQRMRLAVLKHCVATGRIKTPEDLARIHTQQDFRKYLKDVQTVAVDKPKRYEDGFVVVDIV